MKTATINGTTGFWIRHKPGRMNGVNHFYPHGKVQSLCKRVTLKGDQLTATSTITDSDAYNCARCAELKSTAGR